MRQEAVNTFEGGVNYDLNPLTTPANILTDAINSGFITFNGDELALQTDAGNTTIKYLETDVHLTQAFYPLGIKEYGGVLYIISGKHPTNTTSLYDTEVPYAVGDIVYNTILDVDYYFECLTAGGNNLPTSTISDENWLYIGIEKDFINKYGSVEFGSYPSPEIINADIFDTSVDFDLVNEIATPGEEFKLELYKPKIINRSIFRAGVYVNFHKVIGSTLVTDNISYDAFTYDVTNKVATKNPASYKNIYKVKLYHQLTNGYIDLTDNVWEQYAKYVGQNDAEDLNMTGPPRFWFNDNNFNYHCPHNFKGKLVTSVELEELDVFKLSSIRVDYTDPNYEVNFGLTYTETAQWNQGISPNTCTIYYTTDGSEPNTQEVVLTTTVLTNQDVTSFIISFDDTIPGTYNGKTMRYKIIPDFYFDGVEIDKVDIPQQFLDLHTIVGSQLITSEMAGVKFITQPATNLCEVGNTGYRIADYLDLVNNNDENLDSNLDPAGTDVYQFYNDNITPNVGGNYLGSYTIGLTGLAELASEGPIMLNSNIRDYVISLLEATLVKVYDVTCTTVILTVNVNATYGATIPITVMQGATSIVGTATGPTTFTFPILPGVNYTISPSSSMNGIIDAYDYIGNTLVDEEITYGFVIDLHMIGNPIVPGGTDYEDFFTVNVPIGSLNISFTNFTNEQTNVTFSPTTENVNIVGGESDVVFSYDSTLGDPTYLVTFSSAAVQTTYINIADSVVLIGDAILLETYTL